MPPMTLNVERLYQDLTDLRETITSPGGDMIGVRELVLRLIDVHLAAIDHPYPTPTDAG